MSRHLAAACVLLVAGCGPGFERAGVARAQDGATAALPGWQSDRVAAGMAAFLRGCPKLDQRFAQACADASRVRPGDDAAARDWLTRRFRPTRLGSDMATGYFELTVEGARERSAAFPIPVLAPPPHPDRYGAQDVANGALDGRGLELAWLRNRADLFFLMLQGSGRVHLDDGHTIRLGTAASNNRHQIPTERLFGDAGIPGRDLSIAGIRAWVAAHPAEGEARLARDPSYVFFRETPGIPPALGPYGALGVPLTPLRSVAASPGVPLGTPLWISTTLQDRRPFQALVVAQDTGDQIRGLARLDLFFGAGPAAEAWGGRQYARSDVWLLQPR